MARADERSATRCSADSAADVVRRRRGRPAARRLRAVLSALGIAIGIARMVAVLGLSESCARRPAAPARPARHEPAHRRAGADASAATTRRCPRRAAQMLAARRRRPARSPRSRAGHATVRRSDRIDAGGDRRHRGRRRRPRPARHPGRLDGPRAASSTPRRPATRSVVLGPTAARQLGIDRPGVAGLHRAGAGSPCRASWPRCSSRPSSTARRSWATTPRCAQLRRRATRRARRLPPRRPDQSSRACTTCSGRPPTPSTPRRSTSAARPTRSPRARRPTTR